MDLLAGISYDLADLGSGMALSTTVGGVAALLASGGYLLRRRLSRSWITPSSIAPRRFAPDQTVVITGGNAGLGYETARDLARRGGRVVLACRDVEAGERAAAEIRRESKNEAVAVARLDLSSLESVREFAEELIAREMKVCALICNAGVWMPKAPQGSGPKTKEGFEIHFGVNHLGHFALIQLLIPKMERSGADCRIILVGSSLCKSGKIDLRKRDFIYEGRVPGSDKKQSFAPTGYCDSKLMNMITSRELAVRFQESKSNIVTYCVSPGFCKSQLGRNHRVPLYQKIVMAPLMRFFQRSSAQGAQNILFVVTEDSSKLESGAMYQDGVIWEEGEKFMATLGDDLQKGLWDLSKELIEEKGEG